MNDVNAQETPGNGDVVGQPDAAAQIDAQVKEKAKDWKPDAWQLRDLQIHLLTGMEQALERAQAGHEGRELIPAGLPDSPLTGMRVMAEMRKLPDANLINIGLSFAAPIYIEPGSDRESKEAQSARWEIMRSSKEAFDCAFSVVHGEDGEKGVLQTAGLHEKAYSTEMPAGRQYGLTMYGGSVKLAGDDPAYKPEGTRVMMVENERREYPAGVTEMNVSGMQLYMPLKHVEDVLGRVKQRLQELQQAAVPVIPAEGALVSHLEQPPREIVRAGGASS